jgi:branched-chain amino acid transport system ATP-binding protein
MTVLDNVLVGTHVQTKTFLWAAFSRNRLYRREEREMRSFSLRLLEKVGLQGKDAEYAGNLPYGEQRKLEIARGLASKPKILLLDEPAAGMNTKETNEIDGLIKSLRDEGLTILLIEHDMKLVMSIADIISVLDYGDKIAEGSAQSIQTNGKVIEAYLGKQRQT